MYQLIKNYMICHPEILGRIVKLCPQNYFFYRKYKMKQYIKSHDIRKLQLGSGKNVLEEWLNTDSIPLDRRVILLDVNFRLPFEDNVFDYIYSEHMIEHISYEKVSYMFQECYRVLKPGGIIRVATPDLHFLIDLLNPNKTDIQQRYIRWAIDTYILQFNGDRPNNTCDKSIYNETFVINNFFTAWGHKFIYDFDTLKNLLESIGFEHIIRCECGRSDHKDLQNIENHGKFISDEFNNLETMTIEGRKRDLY